MLTIHKFVNVRIIRAHINIIETYNIQQRQQQKREKNENDYELQEINQQRTTQGNSSSSIIFI